MAAGCSGAGCSAPTGCQYCLAVSGRARAVLGADVLQRLHALWQAHHAAVVGTQPADTAQAACWDPVACEALAGAHVEGRERLEPPQQALKVCVRHVEVGETSCAAQSLSLSFAVRVGRIQSSRSPGLARKVTTYLFRS